MKKYQLISHIINTKITYSKNIEKIILDYIVGRNQNHVINELNYFINTKYREALIDYLYENYSKKKGKLIFNNFIKKSDKSVMNFLFN